MRAVSINNNKVSSTEANDRYSLLDRLSKKMVLKWLQQFTLGYLTIDDGDEQYQFGQPKEKAEISAHISVKHPSVYTDVLFNGTTGSGEAYMRGSWQTPNLVNVIRLMCQNMDQLQKINTGWARINGAMANLLHRVRANSKTNARFNIAAHYDLGNDFFELFLDPTMMYSAAIYPTDDTTLEQAAVYKLEHICQRLQLTADDHLLEIGTGWGGMAIYAATHYGCRVTTTTISQEQYKHALSVVKAAGLDDKITVLLDDYRDLEGQFDKLVSIEMIEAVGRHYYPQYFSTCSRLLKPDGLMLIQAITMPDQRYELTSGSTDFIQRYIFPGGDLPCPSVIAQNVAKHSDMQIVGLEDITLDYALTLQHWRERFIEKLSTVKMMGYDDIFIRMWEFYLSYCEGGFRERTIGTLQVLMAKPRCMQLPHIG